MSLSLHKSRLDWRHDRLKDVASLRSEKTDEKSSVEDYLELEDIESWSMRILNWRNTEEVESAVTKFEKGDVLFGKLRPYLAKVCRPGKSGKCTGEILAIHPTHIDGGYLQYALIDPEMIKKCTLFSYGAKMPRVNWTTQLSTFEIPIPPRPEQERIAAFLDEKCATVDKAIEVKRKQLDSIAGQRKSLITQSVVSGLGPCQSRKTDIEWMPLVNSGWEVVSLKRLLSRKMEYGLSEAAELEDESLPRYIRITDFGDDGELKDDTFRSLPVEIAKEAMLQANDVLFARSGATVGKSYIYTGWRTGACFAGYLIRAQTKPWRLNPKFLYYFTKSAAYDAWKGLIFTQATIQNISAVKYGQLRIPVPPVRTQNEIVSYLEAREVEFDSLAANLRKQIEILKQYRKSLIHEYVTGVRRVV